MIHLEKASTIYVMCPSRIVTGGIEAVHQLVDKLRKFGHNAVITPIPAVPNPVLLQYRNYDVEFCEDIQDDERHLLITTEVNPRALDSYRQIQKAVWWLSVDNHERLAEQFDFDDPANNHVVHFAQSAYAFNFLKQKGIQRPAYLSDYLHETYLRPAKPHAHKHNLILYTPVKGSEAYVEPLMQADPSLQWLALKGMIRKKHAKTLRQGKVYVDFGTHPGKDRQPREAAVNGCCVIVGRKGAACFAEDIPIPEDYKFDAESLTIDLIIKTLQRCLFDHERRVKDFDQYAQIIRSEEERFEQEVTSIFGVKSIHGKSSRSIITRNTLKFIRQNNPPTVARGLANEFLPLNFVNGIRRIYRRLST